jgi:uncharacterized protein (DUF934 family)
MSVLIRHEQLAQDDYVNLADDAALPSTGKAIVSLARWQLEESTLRASGVVVGVRIPNTVNLTTAWSVIGDRPLIALEFPSFGDGRAYSQARLLHDRYKFKGEIRATGAAVVRDQIHNMHRSGITAFELRADQDPKVCLTAFKDFTQAYQPAADSRTPVSGLRKY